MFRLFGATLCLCETAGIAGVIVLLQLGVAHAAIQLPQGPHRDLVYGKCRTCHDLGYLKSSMGITRTQWRNVLDGMEGYGLEVTPQQKQQLLSYLGTYLGLNPPTANAKSTDVSSTTRLSGKEIFSQQCSARKQSSGQGQDGQIPRLAGNPDLFRSREFPVLVILNGLKGKINVNGVTYDNQMPSFDFLSNDKIAAVVQYVRNSWGNQHNRPTGMKTISSK